MKTGGGEAIHGGRGGLLPTVAGLVGAVAERVLWRGGVEMLDEKMADALVDSGHERG